MNKQIRELALQAGMHRSEFGYGRSYDQVIWGESNIEEFAELIIEECISACATDALGKIKSAEELITQRFGLYNEN